MRLALKWIKRLVITLIIICLAYSIAWFIILNLISRELNKQYSGQAINTTNIGVKEQYVLKFSKIEAVGFPFKISFKILNWHEESRTSQISFSAPIYVGYDLLKQHIFIAFSGDIIAKYKPLESGFGARFRVANQEFLIKYPITMRLIKVLLNKNNPFEVVNFIKSFESSSGNIQIFDLVDNEKFYEEDHLSFKLLINKPHYYTSLSDFLDNVPQKFDITYAAEVLTGIPINRVVPRILLLPKIIWNFAFKVDTDFYIKSNNKTFNDFNKDLEVGVTSLKSSSDIHTSSDSVLYQKKIDNYGESVFVKLASNIELKNDIYPKISNLIKYLISGEARYILGVNYELNLDVKNELQYIVDNPDKFNFRELENRKYECNLELSNLKKKDSVNTKIHSFSIFSGDTGVNLRNEIDFLGLLNVNINGAVLLNNYPALIDLVSSYLYRLGKYKTFSDESRAVYRDTLKSFMHSISDHPESISSDLSLEYAIDFSNLNNGKIGVAKINTLRSLYHIALYRKALDKIQIKNSSDDIATLILKLVPTLTNNPKLLEQLITKPTEIDKKTWEEIIK